MIKERQIPSPIDILMKIQSSGNLSDFVSGIVKDFIDKEYSSIQAPVVQKSVIQKPTNNPCKDLPTCDVACQDTIPPYKTEFVEQNSLARAQRLNLVLQRSGGNKTKAKLLVALQPV